MPFTVCGVSAMSVACYADEPECVRLLLEYRVNPNTQDGARILPLALACNHGSIACVRELLENGAEVETADWESPLFIACRKNYPACVKLLMNAGADPHRQNESGETPLDVALGLCAEVILLHTATRPDQHGRSPLWLAAHGGIVRAVHTLLASGADPDKADDAGLSPLHAACVQGNTQCALLLVERGADPCLRTKCGLTPTTLAQKNVEGRTNHGAQDVAVHAVRLHRG